MMQQYSAKLAKARIKLLRRFVANMEAWHKQARGARERRVMFAAVQYVEDPAVVGSLREIKRALNRDMIAARDAVTDLGLGILFHATAAPAAGGRTTVVDPFSANLFQTFHGGSPIPMLVDTIEQAVGMYEHLAAGDGMVRVAQRDALDALTAIEKGLRLAFDDPPAGEKDVQRAAEAILASQGVSYTREKEAATVGARNFVPDFVLSDLDTALEIKLTNERHSASKVQEEIAADVSGYLTRWKHVVFVIYDVGAIAAPDQFARVNLEKFNVNVIIVKH